MEATPIPNLNDVLRAVGRGLLFYAGRWDPALGDPLAITHLGDTEGDIVFTPNAEIKELTTPELTGGAAHEADYMGEKPTLEFPLYLADPALLAIVSPIGTASAGRTMRSSVQEYTLVVFPETLFKVVTDGVASRGVLKFSAGAWTLDDVALDAAQLAMLDQAIWLWRGYFSRPPRRMRGGGGDDSKNIESVTFQVMQHEAMPEGHQLYTQGNPFDYAIDLDGGS